MVFDVPLHWMPKIFPFWVGLRVTASWATTLNPGPASNKKAAITQSLECNFALTEDNAKRVLISLFGDRSLFTDDAMEVRKRFTPRRSGLVGALLMKAELKSQAPFAQRAEKNYQNARPELSLFPGILWRVLGAGRGLRIAPLGEPSSASIYGASRPRTAICQRRSLAATSRLLRVAASFSRE